jgi:hypothetical protein
MVALNSEMEDVLKKVSSWPVDARLRLARRVLESLEQEPDEMAEAFRGDPVESVLGILSNGNPPPDDAECQRILEEERVRRFGP